MQVDVVSDATEFGKLAPEWNALSSAQQTPLHSFEWFDACRQANENKSDLAVFVGRIDGVARVIAPFVIDRSGLFPVLQSLDHFTAEFNRFIYSDESALAPVCDAIFDAGLPLVLRRLPTNSDEMRHLSGGLRGDGFSAVRKRGNGFLAVRKTDGLNYVPLEPEWSTLEQKMTSSSRRYLRRRQKIAQRSGRVRFDAVSPNAASVDLHLEELFRIEGASWKAKAGTAIIKDSRMRRFCEAFAAASAKLGTLRMFFLRIGDEIVAAKMTVEYEGRLWELKIGYDERWANCSPGLLLTNETLRYACSRGLKGYEFLGGAEAWHRHWPIESRACGNTRYYSASIGGGIRVLQDAVALTAPRRSHVRRATAHE